MHLKHSGLLGGPPSAKEPPFRERAVLDNQPLIKVVGGLIHGRSGLSKPAGMPPVPISSAVKDDLNHTAATGPRMKQILSCTIHPIHMKLTR
jgi:hypothetical protein